MSNSTVHRPSEQRWDEPYPLLPAQYAELSRTSETREPERRLMLAVLSDAIVLFQTRGPAAESRGQHEFEEARRWIFSDDLSWPFSFVNVCEALGIAFEPLRRALLCGSRQRRAGPRHPAARRRLLAGVVPDLLAHAG